MTLAAGAVEAAAEAAAAAAAGRAAVALAACLSPPGSDGLAAWPAEGFVAFA